MKRKVPLITGNIYHVFNRSIATYVIFNNNAEYSRFLNVIRYYQRKNPGVEFSRFINNIGEDEDFSEKFYLSKDKGNLVEIISYCLMPTHFHLVLNQLVDKGISKFMNNIQNSYSRYFNLRHQRKGPLWESRFKNVSVDSDEQLLHLTRYIHLNAVKSNLVKCPEDWVVSSYNEYVFQGEHKNKICEFDQYLEIGANSYREFVNDEVGYKEDLESRKRLFLLT